MCRVLLDLILERDALHRERLSASVREFGLLLDVVVVRVAQVLLRAAEGRLDREDLSVGAADHRRWGEDGRRAGRLRRWSVKATRFRCGAVRSTAEQGARVPELAAEYSGAGARSSGRHGSFRRGLEDARVDAEQVGEERSRVEGDEKGKSQEFGERELQHGMPIRMLEDREEDGGELSVPSSQLSVYRRARKALYNSR